MPAYITAKLVGVDRFINALNGLAKKVRGPIARMAVRSGGSVIRKGAVNTVPKRTRQLQKSLGIKVVSYPSGNVVAIIGAREGFRVVIPTGFGGHVAVDPFRYSHLPEKGRKPVQVKKKKVLAGPILGYEKAPNPMARRQRNSGPAVLGFKIFGKRVPKAPGRFWLLRAYHATRVQASQAVARTIARAFARRGWPIP